MTLEEFNSKSSKTGCIYKHSNKINGKCYIGKTTQSMEARWRNHCSEAKRHSLPTSKFHNALRKYGYGDDVWEHEVIVKEVPIELLDDLERNCIHMEDSYKNGYNTTEGGEATKGYLHTEESKLAMSIYRKGRNTGISNSRFVPWYYITPNGTYVEVYHLSKLEWAKQKGYTKSQIRNRFTKKFIDKTSSQGVFKGWCFGNIHKKRGETNG